jgi:hypothetical protein
MVNTSEDALARMPNPSRYYIYCVIPTNGEREFGKIGIGGPDDQVYSIEYKDIAAVVSNPPQEEFERSEENIMAHQRVVQRVFNGQPGLPLPFATILSSEMDVQQLLEERYAEFKDKLTKLGSLGESGSQVETGEVGARELLEETLAQSAASAVRIRQLNEEISQLSSMRYAKAMEAAAYMMMKKLSTQLLTSLDSLNRTIETLQEKLNLIKVAVDQVNTEHNVAGRELIQLPSIDSEIRTLREEIERLNRRRMEEMSTTRIGS